MLLEAGASPNIPNGGALVTVLHRACEAGHLELIELLLKRGASPCAYTQPMGQDKKGQTPFQWLVLRKDTPFREQLAKIQGKYPDFKAPEKPGLIKRVRAALGRTRASSESHPAVAAPLYHHLIKPRARSDTSSLLMGVPGE